MGKNSPSFVLKTVFKKISNIENVIKDSKVIEQSYELVNFDDGKEVRKIIEDTKQLVTTLKDEAVKIDDYFKKKYTNWSNDLKDITGEENLPSEINTVVNGDLENTGLSETVNNNTKDAKQQSDSQENLNTNCITDRESDAALVKNVDKECELTEKNEKDIQRDSEKDKEYDSDKETNAKHKESEAIDENNEHPEDSNKVVQENVLDKEKETDKDLENENIEGEKEKTSTRESDLLVPQPKVFLKCVDITKLVKPDILPALKSPNSAKKNKRVSINDTILIISDSDNEETRNVIKKPVKRVSFADDCKKSDGEGSSRKFKEAELRIRNGNKEKPNLVSEKTNNNNLRNSSKKVDNNISRSKIVKKEKSKKGVLEEKQLSDTSSLSDSNESDTKSEMSNKKSPKHNSPKKQRNNKKEELDATTDKKFSCKAFVPLPRIACERLKEVYLNNKDISEIERLTNLNTLKRSRKNQKKMQKEDSSSDSENVKPKAKKQKVSTKKTCGSDDSSSDEDVDANRTSDQMDTEIILPTASESRDNELDNSVVNMLLDTINSGSDKSANESDADDEDEDAENKKKSKKHNSDKNSKEVSKKKNKSESDDESDSGDEKRKKNINKDGKKSDDTSEESSSDDNKNKKKEQKSNWRKDKLLTATIIDSESEDGSVKFKKGSEKAKQDIKARLTKKKSKHVIDSDSGSDNEGKKKKGEDSFIPSSSSSSSDSSKSDSEKEDKEKKKRSRIKRVKDSSSDEENKSTRKSIRKVIAHESLAETTKQAEKEERERKARIAERQKKYNRIFDADQPADATVEKVVLDFDEKSKKEIIAVNKDLVKKLKPHQAKGIQFMWDACFESVERIKNTEGSGCILAHCMGLGKTLQVIALVHTLINYEELTNVKKVLVVCPVNTVLNWVAEFERWLADIDGTPITVYDLVSSKQAMERKFHVEQWTKDGGVLIMGYDMFRNLTNPTNKRLRKSHREIFQTGLVSPGPDLVVCDEGHLLKNEKCHLNIAMNRIRTIKRIVLTGTPMQNNLKEYYCMVQFVKPNLLGTYKEYLNRFVNPITNGQYTDSTQHDINIMRKRSHVLHKMLDGVVQRKDYSVLTPYLPPKYEYVLFLTLSEVQIKIYQHYLSEYSRRPPADTKMRTSFLFVDFQEFQRICTHPRVLLLKSEEVQRKKMFEDDEDSEGSLKDFINDDSSAGSSSKSSSSSSDSDSSGSADSHKSKDEKKKKRSGGPRLTRNSAAAQGIEVEDVIADTVQVQDEWWSQFCSGDELDNIALSSKLYLLFEILQHCELIGDKLLVFSQSLYSLNIIEYFLARIDEATQKGENEKVCGFSGSWAVGLDYFRIDGSSSCDNRSAWCQSFNSPDNPRARLFLISTKAGGLGINLVGANRVVIFDVSWNPSHDIQSIYRVYRFGQTKPCYIYRFVTNGAMEMKIYERQVTKQAISKRVIDEQQIDRHYNQNDLAELYKFEPKPADQPTPLIPKDVLLAELLQKEKDRIFKFHEHQSLLENKEDEELDEAERKAAWEEYENEKTARVVTANAATGGWIKNLPLASITTALTSIVQKDNPTWPIQQVQSVIPLIVQQLREQVDRGESLLFNRIVNELKLLQATQQQRLQEYYMQQQMRMLQQLAQQQQLQQRNSGSGQMGMNFGNAIRSLLNQNGALPTDTSETVDLND